MNKYALISNLLRLQNETFNVSFAKCMLWMFLAALFIVVSLFFDSSNVIVPLVALGGIAFMMGIKYIIKGRKINFELKLLTVAAFCDLTPSAISKIGKKMVYIKDLGILDES